MTPARERDPASVAIVGGGIAGWTAATALRSGGYDGDITIIEAEPLAYDRPPLSKDALVSGAPMESLAFASAEALAAQRITLLAGTAAIALAPGEVRLADGRAVRAERVVVATGAAARRPAFPGAESERLVTVRSYADAARIRTAATPGSRILVLGGGFIGAEVAAALRTIGAEVVLADRNPVPGARVLGETLARWLHGLHAAHGVDVRLAMIESLIDPGAGAPLDVRLTDGSTLAADLVVAGIGMAPPEPLPGLEHAATMLAPADHWDDARRDGIEAAARILGTASPTRGAGWYWSDRYGHHLEVVGELVGAGTEIVRWAAPGRPAAVLRIDRGRLVGAASIDEPNAVRAARRLIDERVPVTAAQLRDPTLSLRDLLRAAR